MSATVEDPALDRRSCSFCGCTDQVTVRSPHWSRVCICGDCALKALRVVKDQNEMSKKMEDRP